MTDSMLSLIFPIHALNANHDDTLNSTKKCPGLVQRLRNNMILIAEANNMFVIGVLCFFFLLFPKQKLKTKNLKILDVVAFSSVSLGGQNWPRGCFREQE